MGKKNKTMTAANIRAELRRFIDEGDEGLLRMMLVVAKEYTQISNEYEFTEEQLKEFEARRAKE